MRFAFSPLVLRRVHTFLSLFFTPLLLLFLITGCWQLLVPEEVREEKGALREWLEKISTIHTDAYYPKAGVADPATDIFKILVGAMGLALVLTILLGLYLAWKQSTRRWSLLALGLGVAVPALILWLA